MTDRRRSRAALAESAQPDRDDSRQEDNPFAPPPEGRPEQPWRPRHHAADGGTGVPKEGGVAQDGDDGDRPAAGRGSRWSSRQPGRQGGPFGGPGPGDRGDGPSSGSGGPRLRWDPTDPLQRHARYALHAGIWALFFALVNVPEAGILLGLPALYWGVHALRGGRRTDSAAGSRQVHAGAEDVAGTERTSGRPAETATRLGRAQVSVSVSPEQAARTRTAAAVSGLVAAGVALLVVVSTFTVQMVYDDFFTCRRDALTQASREQCTDLLPEDVRPFLTEGR
jgi:hypothetical protein